MEKLRSISDIKSRIAYYQPLLDRAEAALERERQKSFHLRDHKAYQFLHMEITRYSLVLRELKWLIYEE